MAAAYLCVTDDQQSFRKSSGLSGVPRSTLQDHINGMLMKKDVEHPLRRLSNKEEACLSLWIKRQDSLGYDLSNALLYSIVERLLILKGIDIKNEPLGVKWLDGFKRRNPGVSAAISTTQESKRFDSFNPTAVKWFFNHYQGNYSWVRRDRVFNVDEAGIMAGMRKPYPLVIIILDHYTDNSFKSLIL